jgi:hypothetical protein
VSRFYRNAGKKRKDGILLNELDGESIASTGTVGLVWKLVVKLY